MPRFRYNTDDCGNAKSQQDEDRYYADQESRSDAEREEEWIPCSRQLPENGVSVMTKIHDIHGERNVTSLTRKNNLWFFDDFSMYVYYTPTHWKPL